MKTTTLEVLTYPDGLMTDGDWIESRDQDPTGEIRLIQLADIGDGKFLDKSLKFVNTDTAARLNCTLLQKGDVLIARLPDPIGRSCVFPGLTQPAITAVDICIVRPNAGVADREWLSYKLNSPQLRREIQGHAQGATRARVPTGKLKKIEIEAPSLEKQSQIAARLKAQLAEVDKARQAADVQLRDATALKAKALEAIFGSVSNKQPIGSAAKLQSGYAFKSESFKTNGIRLLRNANILPGRVYWDEVVFLSESDAEKYPSYVLKDGDVLISLDRPIISSGIKVARVGSDDLPALLVQRVGRFILDPKKLDAHYLYAYLQTDMFIAEITGHDQSLGVPHISPTQVENIEIPMPDVNIQRALSGQLKDALREWQTAVSAIKAQKNDLSILPQSILAQAFEM